MAESTDDCFGFVVSWTIKNFSSWTGDIHDPAMTTEGSFLSRESGFTIELYPRGLSGREERLVVRLCEPEIKEGVTEETVEPLLGDVSFIASDGSLLCRRQINMNEAGCFPLEFPPGPKFRDVVEHITRNESLNKDQLTLRIHLRDSEGEKKEESQTHYMNSVIETFKTTVKIHLDQLNFEIYEECFAMEYPLNDGEVVKIGLVIIDPETAADSIEMGLCVLGTVKNKFVVRTLWSFLKSDGSVLTSERNEHVFDGDEEPSQTAQ